MHHDFLEFQREHCDDGVKEAKYPSSSLRADTGSTIFPPSSNNAKRSPSPRRKRKKPHQAPEERYTPEFPLPNRRTTLNARSKRCKKSILDTPSSRTLDLASTTEGKLCKGYWNKSKAVMSEKLWLPTKIDWRALELSSSSGSSNKREQISSLKTLEVNQANRNSLKTSWRSCTFSLAGRTVGDATRRPLDAKEKKQRKELYAGKTKEQIAETKKELDLTRGEKPLQRCRLVELKLNPLQHFVLKRWFKDARTTYNRAVDVISQDLRNNLESESLKTLEQKLQSNLVGAKAVLEAGRKQAVVLRTPKVIRQQAIKTLISHVRGHRTKKANFEKLRRKYPNAKRFKQDPKFTLKHKSRSFTQDSIRLEKASFKRLTDHSFSMYKTYTKTNFLARAAGGVFGFKTSSDESKVFSEVKVADTLPSNSFDQDVGIHYKLGSFYLILPHLVPLTPPNEEETKDQVCAIDPGIRKLATVYSPEGCVVIVGSKANQEADKRLSKIDRAKEKIKHFIKVREKNSECPKREKKRRKALNSLTRKYHKAEQRAINFVKDVHYKLGHFLCKKFSTIIYPDFNTAECVRRVGNGKRRTISSNTTRRAQFWRFGMLKRRLTEVVEKYTGVKALNGSEAYTSKTCGRCGNMNAKLGSSETFNCPKCHLRADRDIHASRNILLRFLQSCERK